MTPISKIDYINETVAVLVNYCRLCNAKNYEAVWLACKYAINNIIKVDCGTYRRMAKICKEYVLRLEFFANKTAS